MVAALHPCLRVRLLFHPRDGGGFESVADQLVNNAQPLLCSLKAFHGGNGLLLQSLYLLWAVSRNFFVGLQYGVVQWSPATFSGAIIGFFARDYHYCKALHIIANIHFSILLDRGSAI